MKQHLYKIQHNSNLFDFFIAIHRSVDIVLLLVFSGIYCTRKQDAIPAATMGECLLNGGRFIQSIHPVYTKLRCVSKKCEEIRTKFPVEMIDFKYNNCDMDEVEKEMKKHGLLDSIDAIYQRLFF